MLNKQFSEPAALEYNNEIEAAIAAFSNKIFIAIMGVYLSSFGDFNGKDYAKAQKFLAEQRDFLKRAFLIPDNKESQ